MLIIQFNLSSLTFNLDINSFEQIVGLENLKYLEKLNLRKNSIKEIEGLDNFKNLKELDLDQNWISNIQGLETLEKLEVLCFSRQNFNSSSKKINE